MSGQEFLHLFSSSLLVLCWVNHNHLHHGSHVKDLSQAIPPLFLEPNFANMERWQTYHVKTWLLKHADWFVWEMKLECIIIHIGINQSSCMPENEVKCCLVVFYDSLWSSEQMLNSKVNFEANSQEYVAAYHATEMQKHTSALPRNIFLQSSLYHTICCSHCKRCNHVAGPGVQACVCDPNCLCTLLDQVSKLVHTVLKVT